MTSASISLIYFSVQVPCSKLQYEHVTLSKLYVKLLTVPLANLATSAYNHHWSQQTDVIVCRA